MKQSIGIMEYIKLWNYIVEGRGYQMVELHTRGWMASMVKLCSGRASNQKYLEVGRYQMVELCR